MGNEVQNQKTTIQKECPLVADIGTPATGCDTGHMENYSGNLVLVTRCDRAWVPFNLDEDLPDSMAWCSI